ncbi:serine hydrolase [Phenylobacterium aquaticum]|uniref:serine hydrolase n=1 Tax=Phenylobacterium aquaticum TaxID=1763816 RepID=UPI0026ED487D|nr:serine hydrolase [Phenylobacterium aquaticum]
MRQPLFLGLLAAALLAGTARAAPPTMAAFTPPPEARAPAHPFEGRLTLTFGARPGGLKVLRDDDPPRGPDLRLAWPALALSVADDGGRLIAEVPEGGGSAAWDWSVGPGRVWSTAKGDVAVLPVALRETNANCVHNGLLRLVLTAGAVSGAEVRIGAETCLYSKFDAWAAPRARFVPGAPADRDARIARDRANRAAQAPVRPLAELVAKHPGVSLAALAQASGDDQAVYGLVADGVNYAAPCPTRFGVDPFCEGRLLPSYSLAKSLVGGLGLMRLERERPGLARRPVVSLVPDCQAADPWTDVTALDLLDMTTGRYGAKAYEADEDATDMAGFFLSQTRAEKLAFACGHYPRRAAPGGTWVYHTTDSYLLGEALAGAVGGDPYDAVLRPIWRDLKLSPALDETRRTLDAARQPFTGWGLFLRPDDAARLGLFLSPINQARQDELFDSRLIGEALQRVEAGWPAGSPRFRYAHGVWARDISDLIGCARPVWTPFLSGYGGISLVMFPNGVVFYAFGDEGRFDWGPAAGAANAVKALCHD